MNTEKIMTDNETLMRERAKAQARIDVLQRKMQLALEDLTEKNERPVADFLEKAYFERAQLQKFLRDNKET